MTHAKPTNRGVVYTCFSYKGGVGRSMALANVAAVLSQLGRRVLIVDWDLEAPGIENYFTEAPSKLIDSPHRPAGVVDLIVANRAGKRRDFI